MPEQRPVPEQRHRTRAEERAEDIDIRPTKLLAEIDGLKAELATASTQADDYLAALQRERAEFLNFKRRTAEERERELGLAGEDLIRKVLALADDFDRAIEARPDSIATDPWFEGVAAIDRKLRMLLDSEGVSPIDAEPGTTFDPRRARGHRHRPRHRPAGGRDRRAGPAWLSTPRPRPAAGPRGRRRGTRTRHPPTNRPN